MSRSLTYDNSLREKIDLYIQFGGQTKWIIEADLEKWMQKEGSTVVGYPVRNMKYLMRTFKMSRHVIGDSVVWFHKSTPVNLRNKVPV